jgi:hypothetical protein
LNTARVRKNDVYGNGYAESPLIYGAPVIEGYFQRDNLVKEMAIRKINRTLCGLLGVFIEATFISYYFSMSCELNLNKLSRQITTLNDENAELQNNLDRLKSYSYVDNKIVQSNLLNKAAKVIEVQAVDTALPVESKGKKTAQIDLAVGY